MSRDRKGVESAFLFTIDNLLPCGRVWFTYRGWQVTVRMFFCKSVTQLMKVFDHVGVSVFQAGISHSD